MDGKLIDVREENSDQYIHGEVLTVFIEEILQKNKWKLNHYLPGI